MSTTRAPRHTSEKTNLASNELVKSLVAYCRPHGRRV